jgi:putative N6-adenine-specific DNA methylase
MVFNPPYDERLDIHMEEFKNIGDTLKKNYPGTNAWFITGNLEALKFVGLKPSRKIKLSTPVLKLDWKYEMYEGSKRTKFQTQESDSIPILHSSDQI